MDFDKIWNWLAANKDAITSLGVFVTILATIIGGIWAWRKNKKSQSAPTSSSTQYHSNQNQNIAAITAHEGGVVKDVHVGDVHHHGLSVEEALNLAKELAAKQGEQDAQIIKSLQETIQALSQQETATYHIQQALDKLKQGDTRAAEDIFTRIAAQAKQKGKDANLEEATALRHLGSLAFLHDTQKALDAYLRSTALDPDNIDGWNQLGRLYRRIGELDQSENAYRFILKLASNDLHGQAVAYGNLGVVYQTRGELDQAIDYHCKALAIHEVLGSKEGMANQYGNLGSIYQIRGELDQAIDYHRKALDIEEELGSKEGMANQYGNLGVVYQTRGELDQAIDYNLKSLAIDEELGSKEGMAVTYGNLGNIYQIRGKLDQAIGFYHKALVLFEALDSKEGIAYQYGNLGLVYQTSGELDQAIDYYLKSLAINKALGKKEGIAINYANLGNVYKTRGKLDRAIDYWKKSLALFIEIGMRREMAQVQSLLDSVNPKHSE